MNRYTFFLNIEGLGDTPQQAWEDAIENIVANLKEWGPAPDTIYGKDDPISGAEILNGPPYQEFGINHGPDEGPEPIDDTDFFQDYYDKQDDNKEDK